MPNITLELLSGSYFKINKKISGWW